MRQSLREFFGDIHTFHRLNVVSTLSDIIFAIAREDVAAGEGALRTCKVLFPTDVVPTSNMKSSTKLPSISSACARTPDGPLYSSI